MGRSFAKLDKEIWNNERLSRNPRFIALWSFLISNTTYQKKAARLFGHKIEYPIGVFDGTIRDISSRTGVARSSVHRILKQMENLKMIEFCSVENWIFSEVKAVNGTVIRNRITRRVIDLKNYKVIRLIDHKLSSSAREPEVEIATGFAMRIESVLAASPKGKVKLNDVLDFHRQYKKSNDVEDDLFLRNLAYSLSKPRKAFFPYLQKAISYDYGIGHDFQARDREIKINEKVIPFSPNLEVESSSSMRLIKGLGIDEQRRIEYQAQETIFNQHKNINPNTAYFSALVHSEMLQIFNQAKVATG